MGFIPSNRKILRRVHVLPSLLTLGNFACGFFSIVFCLNALFFTTRAQMIEAGHGSDSTAQVMVDPLEEDSDLFPEITEQFELHSNKPFSTALDSNARAAAMLRWACIILFLGMVFDMLDGKVARHMGADSAFGKELDSLADIVTFGIAPPVVVTTQWISVMPVSASWWGQVMIFGVVYAACAALRLARYNVQSGISDKNLFSGMPSPAAAGCVITAVLLAEGGYGFVADTCAWISTLTGGYIPAVQVKARILALFMLFIGALMVTTIRFVHLANRFLVGRKSFAILVAAIFLLALLWHEPRIISFLMFNGYMAVGLFVALKNFLFKKKQKPPMNNANKEIV